MEHRHLIDEVVFDISFDSDSTALEHQDDINALLCESLLPVVDEVCSKYSDADTVLRLDVVEIDMGDVPHIDFKAEMARRIREKLSDVLRDKRAQSGSAAATGAATIGSSISRKHSELAQLETFLTSGSLPWQADIKDEQVHERMLERVIEAGSAAELIALMEHADDKKALVRRLVSQFPDRHLAGLVRQLMPSQAEALLGLIDDFRRVFKEYGLAGTALRESVRLVWQQMIEMMSSAPGASVDMEMLVRSMVKKIASSHGQKRTHTLALMANAAQRLKRDKEIGPTLARLLAFQEQRSDARYDEQEASAPAGTASDAATEEAATDDASMQLKDTAPSSLRHRVAQALLGGDAGYIRPIWDELVREYPELLREALRHYGARAEVRQRIAAGFSDAMLRDMLYLLQPLAEDFLTPLLDHPEPFRMAAGAAAGESREAWIEGLWEASLAYLLGGQSSGFDPRDYVASLLEQMGGADRTLRPALAQAWRDEAAAGTHDELTQILQDMQMLQPAEPAASEHTASNNSDALLRGYDLHERLRQLLNSQAGVGTSDSLIALIDALAAQHPAQLRRVFRELRSGELSLARARLADHEWERLLTACIALDSASGDGNAFLRAIDTHAQLATDRASYFRRVLDDVLHERPVDLEAVLQHSESVEDNAANAGAGRVERSDADHPSSTDIHHGPSGDGYRSAQPILRTDTDKQSDEEKLREFLRRDFTPRSEDSASLATAIERMLAHNASPLRELLASSVVVPDVAARLARVLPERLLTRILLLLRSTEHYAAQYCADGVADAFCLTHANAAADGIARLKWQFIFHHLFENRQAFAQVRFVQDLKDYLVRRAGVADSGEARDALDRHIARNLEFIEHLSSSPQKDTRPSAAQIAGKESAGKSAGTETRNEALPTRSAKENDVPLRDTDADPASLRHRVAQAILSGDAAGIGNVWDELLHLYPDLLREALRHYGMRAEVRYGIAAGFPDAMLRDILHLLEPQAAALAALLLDDPAAMDTGEAWIDGLWEASLDYLLAAQSTGSEFFDPQVFAGSLLKRMADGDRALYRVLAQTWRTAASAAMNEELARILESLQQAQAAAAEREAGAGDASEALLRGYDLHEALRQRLLPRALSDEVAEVPDEVVDEASDALSAAIDALAARHPAQLQRLFRELRSGALSPADARLGADEWQRLVAAFIALDFASGTRTELQRAVDANALHAGDRARYFMQVLDDLLHGRSSELQAVAKRSGAAADAAAETQAADISETRDAERTGIQHRVVQALLRGDASGIQRIWSELLRDYPAMLRDVLRRYGVRPEVRQRLSEGFPEAMLLDMTRVLEPRAAAFMALLTGDSALSHAVGTAGGSGSWDEWKRRLWDGSISSLLATEGVRFEPRIYIRKLLEQITGSDRSHYRALAQAWRNAAASGGPGAADELARVLDAILAEASAPAGKKPADFPRGTAWSQGAGLHEILRQRLLPGAGAADASNNLGAVISTLAARYPEQLQVIYRELRSGGLSLTNAQLSEDEWRRLAAVFVALDPAFGDRGEFLRAVEAHAQRAGNKANYFRQVLDALVHERPIDLEEILAQSGPEDAAVRPGTPDAVVPRDSSIALSPEISVPLQRTEDEEKNTLASGAATGLVRSEDAEAGESAARGNSLYDALRLRLSGASPPGADGGLNAVLDALTARHPDQLQRMVRELRGREWSLEAASLADEEWRRLTTAFVALDPVFGEHGVFLRAIEAHTQRAGNKANYFRQVLDALVHQRPIDLEAILAQSGPDDAAARPGMPDAIVPLDASVAPSRETSLPLPRTEGEETNALASVSTTGLLRSEDAEPLSLRHNLAQALLRGDAAGIHAVWDELLREHRELLRDALRHYGAQTEVRQRIAAGFSDAMLQDITRVLEAQAEDVIAPLLDDPARFHLAAGAMHGTPDAWKRRLWESSLHQLVTMYAGSFSLEDYIGGLLEQIGDRDRMHNHALARLWKEAAPAGTQDAFMRILVAAGQGDPNAEMPLLPSRAGGRGVGGSRGGFGSHAIGPQNDTGLQAGVRPAREGARQLVQGPILDASKADSRLIEKDALLRAPSPSVQSDRLQAVGRSAARERNIVLQDDTVTRGWSSAPRNPRSTMSHEIPPHPPTSPPPVGEGGKSTPESPEAAPPPPHTQPDEEILRNFLQRDIAPSNADIAMIAKLVEQMLAQGAPALRELLESSLRTQHIAARFIYALPERLLTRALLALRSVEHYAVQQCADSVADAFSLVHSGVAPSRIVQWKWRFIFSYLFEQGQPFLQARFASGLTDYLVAQSGVTNISIARDALDQRVALTLAAQTDFAAQTQTSEADAAAEKARRQAEKSRDTRRKSKEKAQEEPGQGEKIHILNAGQVLASPYLPRLFAMLNLTASGAFVDRQAAERGVHLLQFMVNESVTSPEYQLVLNKILCGVRTGIPITPEIEITAHEKNVVEGLIQGMIQNWKTIGTTSVKGLRESFLQREGWLRLEDDAWQLQVQPGTFDMLLDRLPWSFSIIKYPWMERAVHVTWR